MSNRNKYLVPLSFFCALLAIPLSAVYSAGGGIEGKVTDPSGAAIVAAAVTISDEVNNRTFNAVTDQQGRYKVESLPPGNYTVVISAEALATEERIP